MGSLVTLRRYCFPLRNCRIVRGFGVLPRLGAFRPVHFGALVARIADRVIADCVEPSFLLGQAEDVFIDPVFQTERKRLSLDCFL